MFGNPVPDDEKVANWLDQFRRSEPTSQRGALVHENLLQDANVCGADQRTFMDFIAAQPTPATPEAAARQYEAFLAQRDAGGTPCLREDNQANHLSARPSSRLARVVGGEAFMKYNFYATNKRKVPRRHRAPVTVQTGVRLRQLKKKGVQTANLQRDIGGPVVFATSADIADRQRQGEVSADDVRNRLGLDDSLRFGRGQFMVVYEYAADRVPGQKFARPTVLDADWSDVSAAFLPSVSGPAQAGRTQDLATGLAAEPEVLHRSFPANEVETCDVLGPLANDPPDDYRTVRLAGMTGGTP